MKEFMVKLKQQAAENPIFAVGAVAAVITAMAKLLDTFSAARGRKAYAKQVNYRVKNNK